MKGCQQRERSEEEPEGNKVIIRRTHAQTCCIHKTAGVVRAVCMYCLIWQIGYKYFFIIFKRVSFFLGGGDQYL